MRKLTHLDDTGAARMVDVSTKAPSEREAHAEATITLNSHAFETVAAVSAKKGDVLAAARIAGIMAAKKTSELIPLCHPLALTRATVDFEFNSKTSAVRILTSAKTTGPTGVEMEALTAAAVAALTIYDMVKALDRTAVIDGVRLVAKTGGKSGEFIAPEPTKPIYRSAGVLSRVKPATLMGEVALPVQKRNPDQQRDANQLREAFRIFMTQRRLRATQWAKDAGVPVSHIYSFLTGRARELPSDVAQKLASAARVRVQDMFR